MATYKPFIIQKLTEKAPIHDSREWNIWIKSVPFRIYPDMKDIPSRTWLDENGDDEFIPENPFYRAYEIDCEFVYIGSFGSANSSISSFISYLATGGMFSFYDNYTKTGRTNVRYIANDDNILYRRDGQNDIVQFTIKLKINDPITEISIHIPTPLEIWLDFVQYKGGDLEQAANDFNNINPIIKSNGIAVLTPLIAEQGFLYGFNPRTGEAVNFDFSRATSGTYHSKDLNMHLASANMPRLDYKNYSTDAKILIEKANTNLAIQSEGVKPPNYGIYIVADIEMLGFTNNAMLYIKVVDTIQYSYRTLNNLNGKYVYSFLSKSDIIGGALLGYSSTNNAVDLIMAGTYNSDNSEIYKELINIDVYKITVKHKADISGSFNFGINRYIGNRNTADVYLTAFQIEQGNEATSYIPTTTAQVTRSADNLSYTLEKACSVYLKTTKQNIVLDRPAGLWNIHEDLSNEGILQLAIFDRVLTAGEKAQLTA